MQTITPEQKTEPQTVEEFLQQQRDISLLANLARYFGKKSRKNLVSTWEQGNLVVFVDDDNRDIIAMVDGEVVCSVLTDPLIFKKGTWWSIVENMHQQILDAQRQAEISRVRETIFREI